uniref:Ribonuclease H n=1 Tax=Medicago truncatula TaxID=3880 RepID=A2Q624_MEDTR|nr:Ribonuclease H [Medicago truncatula]
MKDFISNIGPIGPIIIWKIWCSRNKCIFEDIKHSIQEIGAQVLSSLHHILKAFAHPTSHSVQQPARIVSWQRPSMNSVALNVDGNVFLDSNLGSFGGLIRDHTSSFLHGFFGKNSRPCILHVEISGLYHGLKLCWDIGIKHVVCHSDSTTVVDLVQKDLNVHHKYGNLIMAIKKLLRRDWVVSLRHTLCEGNAAADFLAKKGALSDTSLVILNEAPPDIAFVLLADAVGVKFVRP